MKKKCKRCEKEKDLDEFGNCSSRNDGKYFYCKECVKIININQRRKKFKNAKFLSEKPIEERLKESIIINKETNCWEWQKGTNQDNYAILTYKYEFWLAHRLSYKVFIGEFDLNLKILHKCDNTICINPDHLFPGTQNDNMKDMVKKNRSANKKGSKNGRAKINEEIVIRIRKVYSKNKYSNKSIAKYFDISNEILIDIIKGKTWTHV